MQAGQSLCCLHILYYILCHVSPPPLPPLNKSVYRCPLCFSLSLICNKILFCSVLTHNYLPFWTIQAMTLNHRIFLGMRTLNVQQSFSGSNPDHDIAYICSKDLDRKATPNIAKSDWDIYRVILIVGSMTCKEIVNHIFIEKYLFSV